MGTAWLTYAWDDNQDSQIDWVAQELANVSVRVKLDRWNLPAGQRLWDHIARFISDPAESDAWIIYLTQNSLTSEACREELFYALNRALSDRGQGFPIIGISDGSVDHNLLPPVIQTRLYVALTDENWKERLKAGVEGLAPQIGPAAADPYVLQVERRDPFGQPLPDPQCIIEVRPRAGLWVPFVAAIPITEKAAVNPSLARGARGVHPMDFMMSGPEPGPSADGRWWLLEDYQEASPTHCYYISCQRLPSVLRFGAKAGPHYSHRF